MLHNGDDPLPILLPGTPVTPNQENQQSPEQNVPDGQIQSSRLPQVGTSATGRNQHESLYS